MGEACIVIHLLEHKWRIWWSPFKELRVVTDFPQLHDKIHQIFNLILRFNHLEQFLDIQLFLNGVIEKFLPFGHLTQNPVLVFFADFMLNVLFHSPKHKRFQYSVESLDLNLVQFLLVLTVSFYIFGKPFVKLFMRIKKFRHNEVE